MLFGDFVAKTGRDFIEKWDRGRCDLVPNLTTHRSLGTSGDVMKCLSTWIPKKFFLRMSRKFHRELVNGSFKFDKRSPLFIRAHNIVTAELRRPMGMQGRTPSPKQWDLSSILAAHMMPRSAFTMTLATD